MSIKTVSRNTVSIHYINSAVKIAQFHQVDSERLLEQAGIPPSLLLEPLTRVPHEQYTRLMLELRRFLRNAPATLLVIPHNDNSLTTKIRAIIGKDFSKEFPDFESVAKELHTTPQTLRRHLKIENTSYQEIKDVMRRDAAIYYLSKPNLSINEIAELMGFSEPSTFHRAFKKWTGLTPGVYRQGGDGITNISN